MCDEGLWALTCESVPMVGGTAPLAVVGDAWKGNSPGSLALKGEPVGADRMILGPPLAGEGMYISSVSFALSPTRNGDKRRKGSFSSPAVGATA
jgi:hypothetical protein